MLWLLLACYGGHCCCCRHCVKMVDFSNMSATIGRHNTRRFQNKQNPPSVKPLKHKSWPKMREKKGWKVHISGVVCVCVCDWREVRRSHVTWLGSGPPARTHTHTTHTHITHTRNTSHTHAPHHTHHADFQ